MDFEIHYLNLKDRIDRDDKMKIKLESFKNDFNINVKRFDAIDGRNLNFEELKKQKFICDSYPNYNLGHLGGNRNLYKGEIGCLLSHIRSWEKLLNSDKKYFIILEDDILINYDYYFKYFKNIINSIDEIDADMVLLGRYTIAVNDFYTGRKINKFIYEPDNIGYGAFAYLITRKGAVNLLKYFNFEKQTSGGKCKLIHVLDQFDFIRRDYKILFNENIKIYSVYPQFIIEVDEDREFTNESKRKDSEFLIYVDDKGDSDTRFN